MSSDADRPWRDLIRAAFRNRPRDPAISPVFNPAAPEEAVLDAEERLAVSLPAELRTLLEETNGVKESMDLPEGSTVIGYLIWPVERITEDNLRFRSDPHNRDTLMPFDHLLFFADAGNGDQFAYAVVNGSARRPYIYAWNHEDDSRKWVAPSLRQFIEWWLSGKIRT